METKKRFRLGRYALVVGIAAGFIFLGMLFAILEGDNSSTSDTLIIVGLCASSMSVFLLSMEEQKKKSCKTANPKV